MKKIAIIVLTLVGSLMAQDYSGIWNGKGGKEDSRYGSVPQTAQITILQAGASVTGGSVKLGNNKPIAIKSGNVSGSQVTFLAAMPSGAQITANLTQNGNQLSGKMYASNGEVFDFVFTKQ